MLELNASDERGIGHVREKVKKYAETKQPRLTGRPSFKVIILDEADQMTADAQNALRRIIEDFATVTRFCILCNYITKIIEPLKSRCVKFRFREISAPQQISHLGFISRAEGLQLTPEALLTIVLVSTGDLRRSVNLLQLCGAAFGGKCVGKDEVVQVSDVLPVQDIWTSCLQPFISISNESERLLWVEHNLRRQAVTGQQLVNALHKWVVAASIDEAHKILLVQALSDAEKRLALGGRDDINILLLLDTIRLLV